MAIATRGRPACSSVIKDSPTLGSRDMRRSAVLAVVALWLASCSATVELTTRGSPPSPARAAPAPTGPAGSPAGAHWAAWLGVQYRQLGARVEAAHVLRSIGPVQP